LLRFEHVSLSYGSQQILDDLSFEIQEGQMAVLIGPSGCGKTTTLKMINRLIEPTAGRIYLDGQDITTKDKVELRRHIGYVIHALCVYSFSMAALARISPVAFFREMVPHLDGSGFLKSQHIPVECFGTVQVLHINRYMVQSCHLHGNPPLS